MTSNRFQQQDQASQSPARITAFEAGGPAAPAVHRRAGKACARLSGGARRELRAAGICDPAAQAGYAQARALNAQHGRTYFLATRLLPTAKRPYVHALYGFARYADDIVDDLDPRLSTAERARRFDAWAQSFSLDLERGASAHPLCQAVLDTIERWQIPPEHFVDFLHSMRMDLVVTEYQSFDDLSKYMWGSAAVIGLQMLPILGREDERTDWGTLGRHAADLGLAFQLTNFLRDIGEDLDRNRIYLPRESLDRFGVDRAALLRARATGSASEPVRQLIAFELERARELYRSAQPGIELVERGSRDCLRTAWTLYGAILDEIEKLDHNVFSCRASVSLRRRVRVAGGGLARATWARTVS
ncbi:MAG TPA: phytoene/squalene synthase family protein [Jatrophihabitans sp.]|jgi:phytoene synthase|uniref:phytoene/squalene synthase family protein n=1 Tax=Jatrophihabitans sp. TaxID=1932789 RepID=UPI002F09B624